MKKKIIISGKIRWLLVAVVILAVAGGRGFLLHQFHTSQHTHRDPGTNLNRIPRQYRVVRQRHRDSCACE